MSVELFTTNLDFLTKLQAVFNLNDFILNFNATQINVQGFFFLKINKLARDAARVKNPGGGRGAGSNAARCCCPAAPSDLPKSGGHTQRVRSPCLPL